MISAAENMFWFVLSRLVFPKSLSHNTLHCLFHVPCAPLDWSIFGWEGFGKRFRVVTNLVSPAGFNGLGASERKGNLRMKTTNEAVSRNQSGGNDFLEGLVPGTEATGNGAENGPISRLGGV